MKQLVALAVVLFSISVSAQNSFTAISVANAEETAKWYARNLGFKEVKTSNSRDGLAKAVILESPRYGLLEIIEHKEAKAPPCGKSPHLVYGIFKFGYYVEDIESLAASLKKNNVEFRSELYEDRPLKVKSFIIFDNNRNLVQFLEREN